MTSRVAIALACAGGLVIGIAGAGTPATAAPAVQGFTGSAASSVAGCPYISWRLARQANGTVNGIAFYSDLSGLSTVSGSVDPAGNFTLHLKSSMGNGPVGTVTGSKSANGVLRAHMVGEGCANMNLVMHPSANLNAIPAGEG